MGCCNSNQTIQEDYEKVTSEILKTIPLYGKSCNYIMSQFITCEKDIGNRKTHSLNNKVKEYSEAKYYKILEFLYNMKFPTHVGGLQSSNQLTTMKHPIKRGSMKSVGRSETLLVHLEVEEEKTNTIYKESLLNKLYFSITPDYNQLFDSVFKAKPKSNFMLFIIAFTKDSLDKKADFFIQILEEAGLKSNFTTFQTIMLHYALMNYNYSSQIYECINSNKSKPLFDKISTEFGVKFSHSSIDTWGDYNSFLQKKKYAKSNNFALHITKELLAIVLENITPTNIADFKPSIKKPFDDLSVIALCELFLKHNNITITPQDIHTLLLLNPYLFDAAKLRKILNDFSENEVATPIG